MREACIDRNLLGDEEGGECACWTDEWPGSLRTGRQIFP